MSPEELRGLVYNISAADMLIAKEIDVVVTFLRQAADEIEREKARADRAELAWGFEVEKLRGEYRDLEDCLDEWKNRAELAEAEVATYKSSCQVAGDDMRVLRRELELARKVVEAAERFQNMKPYAHHYIPLDDALQCWRDAEVKRG